MPSRSSVNERRVVLAEYFMVEDRTLLFIVRADLDEPHVEEVMTPPAALREFVALNFGTTEDGGSAVRKLDVDAFQRHLAPFVEKIVDWAAEGDIVWLVPHDVLHYVPLHVVRVGGQYLIERNPVCYTPSASVMKYCHQNRRDRRERALVLGDSRNDLGYAREEARLVAELFGTTAYLGEEATKAVVTTALSERREQIDVLHFACHGEFDQTQALRSRILLAPVRGPDADATQSDTDSTEADLTAEEIFGLEMRADLVTLSACETGVNDRKPGDELIGLTRALIYAGTPSVIVSLWQVDDLASQVLMERFYQELRAGRMKADALQQAQVDTMRMTAGEVLAYFQEKLDRVRDANDPQRLVELGEYVRTVKRRIFAAEADDPSQHGLDWRFFRRPYDWAPFVLVGDWK